MGPTSGTGHGPQPPRRHPPLATTLVTIGIVLLVLAPLVLFGGFAWIRQHHYGDGTGDLLTPFVWMVLDLLFGAVLIAAGRSVGGEPGTAAAGPGTPTGGRAVKARSLVFDLFGDYLRYRGGEVRLRGLVSLMDCFGVPQPTVRVVVTRLRREGWLASRREGRETVYSLTEAAWGLLDEGRDRIFGRVPGPWDGQWHMIIYSVPETERALRDQLRKRLAWFGFGALSSSVWMSPHDRAGHVRDAFAGEPAVRLDAFRSRSEGIDADRDIAARAWDLPGLDRAYADLLDVYRPRLTGYRSGGIEGSHALVERMRLVHDYRRFPFRDPDLPPELLPAGWHGREAHETFLEAHGLLRGPADACVDALLGDGASPEQQAV